MRLTLRELLLVVALVALGLAFAVHSRHIAEQVETLRDDALGHQDEAEHQRALRERAEVERDEAVETLEMERREGR